MEDNASKALSEPDQDDLETMMLIADPTPQRVLDALAEDTDETGFRQVVAMVAISDGSPDDLPV